MLVQGMLSNSTVNGPGERCVIWVNGCTLGCKGCWNPETHAFDVNKKQHWIDIAKQLKEMPDSLSGITFSGGDPMQQYWDIFNLVRWIRSNKPSWTIGMFTGYSYKEVQAGKWKYRVDTDEEGPTRSGSATEWKELEQLLDFAIMGRYNQLLPSILPMTTTSNQEIKLFSDKYTKNDFGTPELAERSVEITISGDEIIMTGFPVGADLSSLKL